MKIESVLILLSFHLFSLINGNYVWQNSQWVLEKDIEGSGDAPSSKTSSRINNDDEDDDEGSGSYGYNSQRPSSSGEGKPRYYDKEKEEEEEEEDYDNEYEDNSNSYNPTGVSHGNDHSSNNYPSYTNEDEVAKPGYDLDTPDDIFVENSDVNNGYNNPSITGPKNTNKSTSFFAQPGIMAAVVGGAVVGLLCAILFVMFIVYRMRKKDEGSYALDEPKRSPTVNSYSKPLSREIYA